MIKKQVVGLVVMALVMIGSVSFAEPATYKADAAHSSAIYKVKHLDVGYQYGRFTDMSGSLSVDVENPEHLSFDLTIKTASVDSGNEGRDKHLRGADFFSVKQFPVMLLKSTSVKAGSDGNLQVTADMTLRGVTKSIMLDVEIVGIGKGNRGEARAGIHSEFTIKRSDFGMDYMLEGLGDEVRIFLAIEGTG